VKEAINQGRERERKQGMRQTQHSDQCVTHVCVVCGGVGSLVVVHCDDARVFSYDISITAIHTHTHTRLHTHKSVYQHATKIAPHLVLFFYECMCLCVEIPEKKRGTRKEHILTPVHRIINAERRAQTEQGQRSTQTNEGAEEAEPISVETKGCTTATTERWTDGRVGGESTRSRGRWKIDHTHTI
jgi:hypothetical protein